MGMNGFGAILCSILCTLAELCMSNVPWANDREKQGKEQQGGLYRLTPLPIGSPLPLSSLPSQPLGPLFTGRIAYQGLYYIK